MAAVLRGAIVLLSLAAVAGPASADPVVPVPKDLPRYDLTLTVDVPNHLVRFRQVVTWTNRHQRPADTVALNFYPHYVIPKGDRLLLAKTLELLRLDPEIGIDPNGRHGDIARVSLGGPAGQPLPFSYREDNPTEFVIDLPRPVRCGESVTIDLEGTIRLPQKQGRWGQWEGITYLTNAMPVLAYYDDRGWHPTPFVPWHQPFWNEAGVYTASITLPADQKLACSAAVAAEQDCGDGWRKVVTKPFVGRDFALTCSALYEEFRTTAKMPDGREVVVRCFAYARHAFYAEHMLRTVAEALPVFSDWFGPYPYEQFTIAESFFGWNGNELSGMILIDERVFDMPKLARGYVEYLVSHETCHQWWYNQVGTNGSAETFMDEGMAVHFTHRLLDAKRGKNNEMLDWPPPWGFMPNIRREDYRWASWYGAVRRHDAPAAGLPLSEFGSLVSTFAGAYDRGSKAFGMIEARLGPDFIPFIRGIVKKYSFRVLLAADLKAELAAFTGQPAYWDEFFAKWIYGDGLVDWKVESVRVDGRRARRIGPVLRSEPTDGGHTVEVVVSQNRELTEPTVIGFQLAEGDGYAIRVPLGPGCEAVPGCDASVEPLGDHRFRVRATLPAPPVQVTVDPDRVLLDANPADNSWRRPWATDVVPLYTALNDTDLTRPWDQWSVTGGPWFWGPTYLDPWYTRSFMAGARLGVYRTQSFQGGPYVAYRSDYRDIVAGVDALLDHWPGPRTQVGFNYERRIGGPYGGTNGRDTADRAVVYGRYIISYSSSLYLHPMHYVEAFASYQDNFLPFARTAAPGAVRPQWTQLNGLHYRLNLYTPYWDPDEGVWVDLVAAGGVADLGPDRGTAQVRGELAAVRKLPECWGYLSQVKAAGRVVAMGAWPDEGQFFALGGGQVFRGFDLAERQGSFVWAANAELRFPVFQHLKVNTLDSILGLRNVSVAGFYDVGEVYAAGRSVGGVAHALGAGLRLDVSIFSFLERATVRLDAAKTLNAATPVQFWFGVQHPF